MAKAIFGGTFDPVHLGHLAMAESAVKQFDLSEIIVVPNGNPPHKSDLHITEFAHRYNMLCLGFKGMENVVVSDYEANEDKPSYSVYTMRYFRTLCGEDTYFIIGADSLMSIHKWYDYKNLIKENKFIVFKRDGDTALEDRGNTLCSEGAEIYISKMPEVNVSSTEVRARIAKGLSCNGLLKADVIDYIIQNGLYGGIK